MTDFPLQIRWLGRRDYYEAWTLQQELVKQRRASVIPDTLLLLEHPPTFTLGRGTSPAHVLASAEWLAERGFAVVETDRGGDVTYHGPGQLVGYPILNLSGPPHTPDLHHYLRQIEEVLIQTLAAFDLSADRFPGYTGVWVGTGYRVSGIGYRDNARVSAESKNSQETGIFPIPDTRHPIPSKIAAIGIKASRWITSHGFALNVCPDMSHFDLIVPCGIREYGVTSLSQVLQRHVMVAEVLPIVAQRFVEVFALEPFPPCAEDVQNWPK